MMRVIGGKGGRQALSARVTEYARTVNEGIMRRQNSFPSLFSDRMIMNGLFSKKNESVPKSAKAKLDEIRGKLDALGHLAADEWPMHEQLELFSKKELESVGIFLDGSEDNLRPHIRPNMGEIRKAVFILANKLEQTLQKTGLKNTDYHALLDHVRIALDDTTNAAAHNITRSIYGSEGYAVLHIISRALGKEGYHSTIWGKSEKSQFFVSFDPFICSVIARRLGHIAKDSRDGESAGFFILHEPSNNGKVVTVKLISHNKAVVTAEHQDFQACKTLAEKMSAKLTIGKTNSGRFGVFELTFNVVKTEPIIREGGIMDDC